MERAALISAFFRRLSRDFNFPSDVATPGWYPLAVIARLFGYSSAKSARTVLPLEEIGDSGKTVSELGVVILAIRSQARSVMEKVREICLLTMAEIMLPQAREKMVVSELCAEIRGVLDRFSAREGLGAPFSL